MLFMFMSKMAMDPISSSYFTFFKSVLYEPLIAGIEQDRDDYGVVKSSCVSVKDTNQTYTRAATHKFGHIWTKQNVHCRGELMSRVVSCDGYNDDPVRAPLAS